MTDDPTPYHPRSECAALGCLTHVVLPNMAYACDGSIITKGGHITIGTQHWHEVTCPDCLAPGREYLQAVVMWMQGHGDHPDDVGPPAPEPTPVPASEEVALW